MIVIRKYLILILTIFIISTKIIHADISGVVFRDLPVNGTTLNTYGVKDSNELGVEGIRVTAYSNDDKNLTTTTDSNGIWSLPTTADSRIEFSNIPSYLKESENGNVHNSSVQFIPNNTHNVSFGLHNPSDYSNTANPLYVNNAQQNGTHEGNKTRGLYTVHYNATGLNKNQGRGGTGEAPLDTITTEDIGSVWGKAYQKDKQRLFVASMLQRHVGFAKSPADIFVVDYSNGMPASLLGSFSLQGRIPDNGGEAIDLGTVDRESGSDYTLYQSPLKQNIDLDAYAKVGRISYGDIDIDQDNHKLWLVNLKQKGLISVDIAGDFNSLSSARVNQYPIENIPNVTTCTNGELIPWGLSIHEGKGYLGVICNALQSKSVHDMKASVLSFNLDNPNLGFSNIVTFPLDYERQVVKKWRAWADSYSDVDNQSATKYGGRYPEPILSDIEFDKYNNIYLAFIDRYAIQIGAQNYRAVSGTNASENATEYGEILKICNTNGVYEKEGTGSCTQNTVNDDSNLNIPEFFNDIGGDRNRESALGSVAILKGSNQLLVTTEDPHPNEISGETHAIYWDTQGVHTLDLTDGNISNWYAHINSKSDAYGFNGKANGMGDVELITAPAPIEIGDRVWFDSNSDGIQDANESGIEGVKVSLFEGDAQIGEATTNSYGEYYFGGSDNKNMYNDKKLKPYTNYQIRVNLYDTSLQEKTITSQNVGDVDLRDSDGDNGKLNTGFSTIVYKTKGVGYNYHSLDFGFKPKVESISKVSIGSLIWEDLNGDGLQNENEPGIKDVNVTLLDGNGKKISSVLMQTTDENGTYYFSDLKDNSDYSIKVSPPLGYVPCKQQTKANNDDTENDSNIKTQNGNEYISGVFSLQSDTELIESNGKAGTDIFDDSDDDNGDMTVDFCFYKPKRLTLGDYVWVDANKNGLQDANESGQKDINVTLYNTSDCSGEVFKTDITDSRGKYSFINLSAGNYCIKFNNIPKEYSITKHVPTKDGKENSDANSDGMIQNINLQSDDMNEDMGIYELKISGNVFDDGNGDGNINGIKISKAGDIPLFVNLLDSSGKLISTHQLNKTGTYSFDGNDSIKPNTDYKIILTTDKNRTTPLLPKDWNNKDGESIGLIGTDGSPDGIINIHILTENIKNINFGINNRPTTEDVESSLALNPNKEIQVIDLLPKDREDKTPKIVTINTLPTSGILYYNGVKVVADQNITDFNNSKLTVIPNSGNTAVVFTYSATDKTGWSSIKPSRVRMPFYVPELVVYNNPIPISTVTPVSTPQIETNSIEEEESRVEDTPTEEEPAVIYNLDIADDTVDANTTSSKTVIPVLDNDSINDRVTIKLVNIIEGEILWNQGTAVGGTNISTTDTLIVPNEGTWRVVDGEIAFTAEEGFEGTPTPIYYLVEDQYGNSSNIAKVSIKTDCTCTPYTSKSHDSVSAFNSFSMAFIMFITSILSFLFFRREKHI